jgi:hypothetical protein
MSVILNLKDIPAHLRETLKSFGKLVDGKLAIDVEKFRLLMAGAPNDREPCRFCGDS